MMRVGFARGEIRKGRVLDLDLEVVVPMLLLVVVPMLLLVVWAMLGILG